MSGIVDFNFNEFNKMFPELHTNETQSQVAFNMACMILNNSYRSIICDLDERKLLLYLLTAHITFLQNRGAGSTGAINNAHEGSVSVGYANLGILGQKYLGQTQYGLLFLEMVKKYMSGFYVPEC